MGLPVVTVLLPISIIALSVISSLPKEFEYTELPSAAARFAWNEEVPAILTSVEPEPKCNPPPFRDAALPIMSLSNKTTSRPAACTAPPYPADAVEAAVALFGSVPA
jgi:hypothetical protein